MPPRNAKTTRCANCPEPKIVVPKPVGVVGADGVQLWNQALFTVNSMLELMAGYATLGVPGKPVPQLKKLSTRLNELIKSIE